MTRVAEDELVCTEGCGTWLGNAVLLLDPASLVSQSSSTPPVGQSALPFARCLVCNRSLTDLYKGVRAHVMVLGQCLEHGVWLERTDRATFTAMYGREIRAHADELERREAERLREQAAQAREQAEQAYLTTLPPAVADLVTRVATLERTVTALAGELAALRRTIRSDDPDRR